MSSPADPFSILSRNQKPPGFKKPEAKPKVFHHRRGQAPANVEEDDDSDDDNIYPQSVTHMTVDNNDRISVPESNYTTNKIEDEELKERLKKRRQIQRTVIVEENRPNEEEQSKPRESRMMIEENSETKEEEEDEAMNARRRRALLKEKLLEQEQINEEVNEEVDEDAMEEEIEDIEGEEETTGGIALLKPVFVSKKERDTNDKRIEEEIALREEEEKIREKRKLEAKMLLIEATRREENENEDNLSTGEMPNDDDDIDEANQYEQWKIRELKRIKREKEERYKKDKEKAEIERRRRLTDAERAHENKVLGSDDTLKPEKVQYKFMQRYYHKGGFYQDSNDPIFQRDYNVAVGAEDLRDKTMLPKALQVRGDWFGKKGRTKYTHLTDQDTTNFDPKQRVDETIQEKMKMKLGGFKGQDVFDRGSRKKN